MSRCIAVLGCHRSGTSAVAGVLHTLGVNMGDVLIGPVLSNKRGHFEDRAFVELHKQIIGDWRTPNVDFEPYREQYAALMANRCKRELWGIKDPRLAFIFPYFAELCTSELQVVRVTRAREAAARSAARRGMVDRTTSNRITYDDALVLAQLYDNAIDTVLDSWDGLWMSVDYDVLVDDPAWYVDKVADFAGVEATLDAVRFIDPKLRHHRA